jgi:purine-binding chemotaxis protein CheW
MTTEQRGQTSGTAQKFITFVLGGEDYGIDLLQVQEIAGALPITRVPGTPDYVLGLVNLRGQVIPVLDLSAKLGLELKVSDRRCIVFVQVASVRVGLMVDTVNDVLTATPVEILPIPQLGADAERSLLLGVARQGDRLTRLLDIPALLSSIGSAELAVARQS